MGDLQVAIGTGRLDPKKHGGCLDLRLATISLDKKQCQSDKKPNNLHYIFESGVPLSPAERLQDLIVPKKIAANCKRWVTRCGSTDAQHLAKPYFRRKRLAELEFSA